MWRFGVAGIVSLALIVGMFVYRSLMAVKVGAWAASGKYLSFLEMLLASGATLVGSYWFVLIPAILVGCFALALIGYVFERKVREP